MPAAIQTFDLTKAYDGRPALDHLSLTVERGEVFGFLGPNGAGKSTTIRLLLDLIRPTEGRAEILGFDTRHQSHEVRARTAYLPGDLRLYGNLRGIETVELFCRLRPGADPAYGIELARELDLDLSKHANALSKGTRQKLGVVVALLGRPDVLLLDEPTSGLDPLMQHAVWEILRREAGRGATVFFSSHVMSEVEQTCERVGILREGRLVAVEPIAALKGRSLRHVEVSFAGGVPSPADVALPGVRELRRQPPTLEFEVAGELDALLRALSPYHILDLRTEQPTLDELLMTYYTGEAA
ncbi:MAG: ABC transporter ATP-binding protein [Thermoflexaceae bacterium]|nr:ABC transporter ATP-binding protein [Thermoflexaceae bacterium]